MNVEQFAEILDSDFYTGVPDSLLKPLCNYLVNTYGINSKNHIVAANEGNGVALAAGYYLATGKTPVVYLQNSGEGNIVNPVASLLNEKVYEIPCIFIVGWRGEPGVKDEPQHVFQGEITIRLLEDLGISTFIIDKNTEAAALRVQMEKYREDLHHGKSVAFVIKKSALTYNVKTEYKNAQGLFREEAIRHVLDAAQDDAVVSTTGKISRELFELREQRGEDHDCDFLTVGSMGHSSSIALGIAVNKPNLRTWCLDGDGAVLMHMGALAVIGSMKPGNMIHVVLNNGAHESVGGIPTVAKQVHLADVAKACGYPDTVRVTSYEELDRELKAAKSRCSTSFIEVICAVDSRDDLGRPTKTAKENKKNFMKNFG